MALKQLTLIVFRCPPTPPCFSMLHRGIMLAGSWTDHENISSGKVFTLFRLNHHQIHYILCPRMVYDCIKCHPGKCEISESKTAFTCPLQETCSLRSCHISHSPTPKTGKMSLNLSKKNPDLMDEMLEKFWAPPGNYKQALFPSSGLEEDLFPPFL